MHGGKHQAGDNCPANDGAGNAGSALTTASISKGRGLAIGPNGDLFYADYTGNQDHIVSAATGIFSRIAGNGTTAASATANASNPPVGGQPGTSQVNSSRGIGVDAFGNVYVADTGDGNLRFIYGGISVPPGVATVVASPVAGSMYNLTIFNTATVNPTKTVATPLPLSGVQLSAPEDVQCDSNGNVYIADAGNNVVRVLYNGKGTVPGVSNPVVGNVYVVAGYNLLYSTVSNTYPTGGAAPTFPATTVTISLRKISLDSRNNLYIADSNNNAVWFVDNTTGYIRLLAGNFGATAGAAAVGCSASAGNTIGDGCAGPLATIYSAADLAVGADNQGNLYITDAEGGIIANARLRKLLSGLNFPAIAKGSSVTQTLLVHFAVGDTMATTNAFTLASGTDYKAGTPSCTTQTDGTTDCTLPITFAPTRPGYDTATLAIASRLGATNSYLLTGTGVTSAISIDPGSVAVLSSTAVNPQGVAVDGAGNIYTADTGNNRVLIYNAASSTTTTFAGTGTAGYTGDNGAATSATLKAPERLRWIRAATSISPTPATTSSARSRCDWSHRHLCGRCYDCVRASGRRPRRRLPSVAGNLLRALRFGGRQPGRPLYLRYRQQRHPRGRCLRQRLYACRRRDCILQRRGGCLRRWLLCLPDGV